MAQWVIHKSWIGNKWEVTREYGHAYKVTPSDPDVEYLWLPKSEYIPCHPPEQWEEVAVTVQPVLTDRYLIKTSDGEAIGNVGFDDRIYRVRSLVVERRKG